MDLSSLRGQRFGAVLADPPWRYNTWSAKGTGRSAEQHYSTMSVAEICALDVRGLMQPNAVLFLWATWPTIKDAFTLIEAWGFTYKTCAFDWMKADARQLEMFDASIDADMKLGHWTRSNSEPCLLATMGSPSRLNADVRMGIIEPTREHSRKPDCIYSRIERLVSGPFLELFARNKRPGWVSLGNETEKFNQVTEGIGDMFNGSADKHMDTREDSAVEAGLEEQGAWGVP